MNINVQIKQKCFTAPFDTGCQEIIINENAYKMLGKPQLKNSNFYLIGFSQNKSQNKVKPYGYFSEEIIVEDEYYSVDMHVVSNSCMEFEMVLGK